VTRWWWVAAALVACGGQVAPQEDEEVGAVEVAPRDTTPVAMPEFPEGVEGHLTVRSSARQAENRFAGSWPAQVGVCREPTVLQLVARSDSLGTILFVGPAPDGAMVGEYQVVDGREGVPDTATARIGLQTFGRGRPRGLRAMSGTVALLRADSILAGRFTAAFSEDRFRDSILVAASFEAPLRDAPADWCVVFDWSGRRTSSVRPTRRGG